MCKFAIDDFYSLGNCGKSTEEEATKVETNPIEGDVVENKTDENLSKTEKDVALQNNSLSDEETRRIS